MSPPTPEPRNLRAELARSLFAVLAANTLIALFLSVVAEHRLVTNLIYSQAIGLSIFATSVGLCLARGRSKPGLPEAAASIVAGGAAGLVLGTWANGLSLAAVFGGHPGVLMMAAATALFFGGIVTYFFYSRGRLLEMQAQAQADQARRLEQEARTMQTELRLLQAQIEPHFLFNTLSNVVSLVDTDPGAAKAMLLDLTLLLRTALARTRREVVTLAEELDLLRAYLGIMAIRMGPRLRWKIDAAPDTLDLPLPPLLVQPLVENAIRHGLEPLPAGGSLNIRCRRQDSQVVIRIEDSGRGLLDANGDGVGLANVRARLHACWGDAATLALQANPAGGVTATLTLPDHARPHR